MEVKERPAAAQFLGRQLQRNVDATSDEYEEWTVAGGGWAVGKKKTTRTRDDSKYITHSWRTALHWSHPSDFFTLFKFKEHHPHF